MSIRLNLEGVITNYPILIGTKIPIPFCSRNYTVLPGDGTIQGFLETLGENVGRTAIDLVLVHLGLKVNSFFCYYHFESVIYLFMCHTVNSNAKVLINVKKCANNTYKT